MNDNCNEIDQDGDGHQKIVIGSWVTQPECPKGAKDTVKDARRAKSWPKGLPSRSQGPTGP